MSGARSRASEARQVGRFAVVGCVNVAVNLVVFVFFYRYVPLASTLLQALGPLGTRITEALASAGIPAVDAGFANLIGYLAGMINSFVLNKYWTFEAGGRTGQQARRFIVLNLAGLAVSTALILVLVDVLRLPYLPVWFASTALVMVLNFLGNKHWTFVTDPEVDGRRNGAAPDARV